MAALTLEMFEDLHARRDEVERELRDASSAQDRLRIMEAMQAIDDVLGERPDPEDDGEPVITGDPLIDRWEQQLARGEVPNLDEEWSDAF